MKNTFLRTLCTFAVLAAALCARFAAAQDWQALYNSDDEATLIKEICGKDSYELIEHVEEVQRFCNGASRKGANGALAKLEYIKEPLKNGTTVYIANSKYRLKDILSETVPSTKICVK